MKPKLSTVTEEIFYALKPSKQRVLLAKDVLKRIRSKQLIIEAQKGYLDIEIPESLERQELQPFLKEMEEPCTVCALGAMFYCKVDRFNQYVVPYGTYTLDQSDIHAALKGIFSQQQLLCIEAAFEYTARWGRLKSEDAAELGRAAVMYDRIIEDDDRLIAIIQNIIDHKGTFVVPPTPEEPVDIGPESIADLDG